MAMIPLAMIAPVSYIDREENFFSLARTNSKIAIDRSIFHVEEMVMSSLAGRFLVARSSLRDGFFGRSVILLLQHGPDGTFGLVLNRPAKAKEVSFPIFVGGPCKMAGLLLIHGRQDWLDSDDEPQMDVCPGVYVG